MRNKKAFTVVELVIVIAIIAILAAVLIPTFANIIKKANVSKDQQLIRNLNTALASDRAENGGKNHRNMTEALAAAEKFGYEVSKINASGTDNEILWDSKNDLFCYFDGNDIKYIPESVLAVPVSTDAAYEAGKVNDVDYWVIRNVTDTTATGENKGQISAKYSTYLAGLTGTDATLVVTKGIDVGTNVVASVKYENTTAQEATIVTNGEPLEINAPNDTINHFGEAESVNIIDVKSDSSYHEFGTVPFIQIKSGRLVLEDTADVNGIHLVKTENGSNVSFDDIVLNFGGKTVKLTRDPIGTALGDTLMLVCKVEGEGGDEYIWLKGNGTFDSENVYVSSTPDASAATKISEGSASYAAKAVANYLDGSDVVDGGKTADEAKQATIFKGEGTEASPYQISTANQWNSFYQVVYDSNKVGKTPYFELVNDINLAGFEITNYAVDGETVEYDLYMNFVLDGKDKKLSGIETLKGYGQLFPNLDNSTIKNITIDYKIVNSTRTTAMAYDAVGECYFTNVTTTGEISTSANWATAFVAYSFGSNNIYYTNCTNMANIKGGFGNNAYIAVFGSHNGGGVHITFDNCKNYGGLLGGYVGFVGMGNDSAYTFVDENAVQNYGSMTGTKNAGYFRYDFTAASKTIGGVTCEVKKGSALATKSTTHTNSAPANFGDAIVLNEVPGAVKYEVEMSFSIQVYNYDDDSNANRWSGGFPRSMVLSYTADDVKNGKLTTDLKKGYVGEVKAEQYYGYGNTTPSYDNGVFVPAEFDISSANIVLNQGDIYLVEDNGDYYYVFYSEQYHGWYTLLTTNTAGEVTSTQVTVSFSVTAYNPDGSVLSFSSFSYGSPVTDAKAFFND